MNYDLNRPWETLDEWQIDYINTPPEQDCFLLTGRQSGKTTAMSVKAVELCVHAFGEGQNILICSITEKQGYRMLAKALAYATEKYPDKICKGKDKPTMHKIIFKNGAGIYCYSAGETGEGLRGDTIKKLLIDEGSRMSEEFFIATIPMLSVAKGSMDIASTPFGKLNKEGEETFFFKCSKDEHYKKYYISAEDCPRHSKEFLERQKERMSKLQYAQEYKAEFLDELQRLFSEELLNSCFKKELPRWESPMKFLGVDVSRYGGDKNAFVIAEGKNKEVRVTHGSTTQRVSIVETFNRIVALQDIHSFNRILIDDAGVGGGLADFLIQKYGDKIICTNNAQKNVDKFGEKKKTLLKEDMYSNAIIQMEQGSFEILENEDLKESLSSMQFAYNKDRLEIFGGNSHLAEAYVRALWGAKQKGLNLFCYSF